MPRAVTELIKEKKLLNSFFGFNYDSKLNLKNLKSYLSSEVYKEIVAELLDRIPEEGADHLVVMNLLLENGHNVEFVKKLCEYEAIKLNNMASSLSASGISLVNEVDNFVNEYWKNRGANESSNSEYSRYLEIAWLLRTIKDAFKSYFDNKMRETEVFDLLKKIDYRSVLRDQEASIFFIIESVYSVILLHLLVIKEFLQKTGKSSKRHYVSSTLGPEFDRINTFYIILKKQTAIEDRKKIERINSMISELGMIINSID